MRIPGKALKAGVAILAGCILTASALFAGREYFTSDIAAQGRDIEGWKTYAERGHRIGPDTAVVTVVVFADFQCPFCSKFHEAFTAVYDEYPAELALVYRHYTLPRHRHARSAALASECAAEQGSFRAFADLLYSKQDSIGVIPWESFGIAAAVPSIPEFSACLENAEYAYRLTEDSLAARKLEITGTPTLLINERLVLGSMSQDQLRRLVRDRLP